MPLRSMRASTARLAATMPTPCQAPHCTLLAGSPAHAVQNDLLTIPTKEHITSHEGNSEAVAQHLPCNWQASAVASSSALAAA